MYFERFANYFPANFLRDAFSGGRALYYDAKHMIGFDPPMSDCFTGWPATLVRRNAIQ